MRNINDLSDSETLEFLQDMKETYSASIESAIRVADKYGISRDETLELCDCPAVHGQDRDI